VVEDSDGTGKAARNKFVDVAGKTGTGQWKFDKYGRRVHCAWFGGYIPANDPQFAFAAVYEGNPGESSISGGKKVAPIIGDVFNSFFAHLKSEGKPLTGSSGDELVSTGVKKARRVGESGEGDAPAAPPKKPAAAPKPEEAAPEIPPAPQNESGFRRFFKRLRGE
jgi:penicillin-binding protein 2